MPTQETDDWLVEALGVARTLLKAAPTSVPAGARAPAATPRSASGSLPQAMAPDCQVVIGKVPGPANFVLCKAHGHVLDTDKKLIVARNVDEFLAQHPEFRRAAPASAAPTSAAPAAAAPASAAPATAAPATTAPATAAPGAPSGSKAPEKPPPADVAAIVADINATLAALDAQSKRLQDGGIPSEPLDRLIAGLRSRLAAATKSGATAKQLAQLQTTAAAALDKLKKDADRQADAATAGTDKALQDLRDAAAKQIDKLDPANAERAKLLAALKDLDGQIKALQTAAPGSTQGAARQTADKAAQQLLEAAVAAGGNSKEAQKALQDAYKNALEQKYGISLGKHSTLVTENTHFDKVYKMFEQVPIGHVVHDKLKDLSYDRGLMVGEGKSRHGIGRYSPGSDSIQLGDYGKETWPYTDPNTGKAEKPNGFSISVLHELGHSVDARWGIMDKHQGDKGCGGWQWYGVAELAQAVANDFAHGAGAALPADAVKRVVLAALSTGKADTAPEGIDGDGFKKLTDYLAPWIKVKKAHGYRATQEFGDRRYFPFSDKSWLSYLVSEHAALRVTDYQWSAPAEWFAELYAICWYKGEPGPPSVHQGIRAYLPQGKGGGGPGAPGNQSPQGKKG